MSGDTIILRRSWASLQLLVRILELVFLFTPQLSPEKEKRESLVGDRPCANRYPEAAYFFFCVTCSTIASVQYFFLKSLINVGSLQTGNISFRAKPSEDISSTDHSSLAIPRSLQHLSTAFDLHASIAVGIPSMEKYSCSPRATDTRLDKAHDL